MRKAQQPLRVNIYGDSIMRGTVIDENLRYHSMIGPFVEQLEQEYELEVVNRARFGITIQKGYKILKKDIEKGLTCDFAVLEFGGNDCSFLWDEIAEVPEHNHRPFTEVEAFVKTGKQMVHALQEAGVQPIVATLPPLDAERHLAFIGKTEKARRNILQWLGDTQMIYRFHELYSHALTQIAVQTGSLLVDVRRCFLDKHNMKELIGLDGVHPNVEGYKIVMQAFAQFISDCRRQPERLAFA